MSKEFDATTRHLLEVDPRAWLAFAGIQTTAPVEIINSDLSTITTEADKVIRIDEEQPWLVHLELQSSLDHALALRLARYNILLAYRHRLPVQSVAILLRREADGPALNGALHEHLPDGNRYLDFRYRLVRVWEASTEQLLQGGVATLPLAPLTDVPPEQLRSIVERIDQRLQREVSAVEAKELWSSTFLLMGLRYSSEFAYQLLQAVRDMMTESTTYQFILEKGRATGQAEEARRLLLLVGAKKLGPPSLEVRSQIESLDDIGRIEALTAKVLDVGTWRELLMNQAKESGSLK